MKLTIGQCIEGIFTGRHHHKFSIINFYIIIYKKIILPFLLLFITSDDKN